MKCNVPSMLKGKYIKIKKPECKKLLKQKLIHQPLHQWSTSNDPFYIDDAHSVQRRYW
jgi:hypothetical protein